MKQSLRSGCDRIPMLRFQMITILGRNPKNLGFCQFGQIRVRDPPISSKISEF
jgi:hypothetical protein